MNERRCPVCGEALEENADACHNCKLDGLNQLFLSKEAYWDWYEREVISRKDRFFNPQVFAGARHFLILLGSGDLYAVGNNYNGACGPDLPQELTKPVRIARNVKHAAAGKNHTVYITGDGEVRLIGNSDLSDRFQWDLRARYVFSNGSDTFFIKAYDGALYGFGENGNGQITPVRRERLRDFEKYTVRILEYGTWNHSWYYGTPSGQDYCAYYSKRDQPNDVLSAVKCSDWYIEQVRAHGEKNIIPDDVLLNKNRVLIRDDFLDGAGEPCDYYAKTSGYERRRREYEEIQERQIQVFLENRVIYEPVRCEKEVSAVEPYRYFDADGCPCGHEETVLRGHKKQYFRSGYGSLFTSLYENGDILFLERLGTHVARLKRSAIGNAVDFAWSADGDGIIVATRDGEILWRSYGDNNEDLRRFRICEYVNWRL